MALIHDASPVFGIANKFSIQNDQIKLRMFHFNQRFEYASSYQGMSVVLYLNPFIHFIESKYSSRSFF